MKRVVVAIYIDPDFYPPTINAILNLAEMAGEVLVVSRNNSVKDYPYPANVRLKKIGKPMTVRDMEQLPARAKIGYFLQFTASLFRYAKSKKTGLVLVYDPLALLAFYIIRRLLPGKKIWYHNHDMPERAAVRKYSLGAYAAKYESSAMKQINFFSLPSKERLLYYPGIEAAAIPVFIIPNYPSLKVYHHEVKEKRPDNTVTTIYQGFIGKGHSLEELIELIREDINGFHLRLILKGSVTPPYKKYLNELAATFGVTSQLSWAGIGPYYELPALTAACDIGIGINMNSDRVSQAQGTASNKIYEYAASGLPVLLFDSAQFRQYLQPYNWAFFTDGSVNSIRKSLQSIIQALPEAGKSARHDFESKLNFENFFMPALLKVMESVKQL